jgi:hypothetical protein
LMASDMWREWAVGRGREKNPMPKTRTEHALGEHRSNTNTSDTRALDRLVQRVQETLYLVLY